MKQHPPLLPHINYPDDLKTLSEEELERLAQEIREETILTVAKTGGHLGAGLGVVELTVALHYCFNTPNDKIIWDVGHQSYPHKILTGRKNKLHTLRQGKGLSGFTKRTESIYDPFGAGHSSTSISAALGIATARDLKKEHFEVISVIGDGAMSAGMAYEAMNNAGDSNTRLIVILNDNKMSIAPAVGAMSNYLAKLISSQSYLKFRSAAKHFVSYLPSSVEKAAKKAEQYTKSIVSHNNFFEEMGFYYIGPLDGHNLSQLVHIFKNIKQDTSIKHPLLIHIVTEKGHGYDIPEAKEEKLHAVQKFNLKTRKQQKSPSTIPSYTSVFADTLIKEAGQDEKIIAITAAMPSGTGLNKFAAAYPERCFDVGIAEQHAVTFAAGLASEGYKPFCAIYSTFLQRAYDQIVHDVAIQKLPVRFAIDRAGLVGADGPTHAGSFDITFLASLPNFIVMAPSDEAELARMIKTASHINDAPCAFRYPRGEGTGIHIPDKITPITVGKGKLIQEGNKIAIVSYGDKLHHAKKAAEHIYKKYQKTITIADARFVKPLDTSLIKELMTHHSILLTIESGAIGGFSTHVLHYLHNNHLLTGGKTFLSIFLPDRFIDHNDMNSMYDEAGLNTGHIIQKIMPYL